jgi:hypothetical protein
MRSSFDWIGNAKYPVIGTLGPSMQVKHGKQSAALNAVDGAAQPSASNHPIDPPKKTTTKSTTTDTESKPATEKKADAA